MKWICIFFGILLLISSVSGTIYTNNTPPAYSLTYVNTTTIYDIDAYGFYATNLSISLIGDPINANWMSRYNVTSGTPFNQSFQIDLGTSKIINQIYYENYHSSGADTDWGSRNFTFWGSNLSTSFLNLTFTNYTGWTQLGTNITKFINHTPANTVDPRYILVNNSSSYRYYSFRFSDGYDTATSALRMGLRRIALQTAYPEANFTSNATFGIAPRTIQFNDTSLYTTGWNWSYKNLTPGNNTEIVWNTTQNPRITLGMGNWNIYLNASNAVGYNKTTYNYTINITQPTNWTYSTPGTYYWVAPANITTFVIQMAGGGGGGASGGTIGSTPYKGMGGDAGESFVTTSSSIIAGTNYTIVVGAGGAEAPAGTHTSYTGTATTGFLQVLDGGAGGIIVNSYSAGGNGSRGILIGGNASAGGAAGANPGGTAGSGYGGGGGGGASVAGPTYGLGGRGSDGIVMISDLATDTFGSNIPQFSADITTSTAGSLISFTDESILVNYTTLTYNWSFGDGTYSEVAGDVKHVYAYLGSYDVSLTLSNSLTDYSSEIKPGYINIVSETTTYASPKTVTFICTDFWNNPIPDLTINATPLNFTAPDSWIQTYYGFGSGVTLTTTGFSGITASDGSWAAPMSESIRYNLTFMGVGISNYSETIYPSKDYYYIRIPTAGVYVVPTPATNYITYTLSNYTINATHEFFNLTYRDTSGGTTNLTLNITNISGVSLFTQTNASPGTNTVNISSGPIIHAAQDTLIYKINSRQSQIGSFNITKTITWQNLGTLVGFPTWVAQWFAIGLIVLLTAAFSILSKKFALIIIPGITFFLMQYMGWLQPTVGIYAATISLGILFTFGVLIYIQERGEQG